ncbi:sporulation protein YunB [Rossellomorea vietnamensis]|uniref:Sporulation protein YunB n=2 Tax=Rossellomorea TaxID=2837508 RepID=A0A5D4NZ22_9BACI|nr:MULTISPECIES: sporulation protein YunB [Rossellomorea]TYR76762.1 sporulation protein YunB [Rossellomorea vietnamensis]TYS19555.1 sporulation protein YunB [Rossellomorea vietnamensis]TYS83971.1 sporulation protein YunB [Rossellomorea aquimaris]
MYKKIKRKGAAPLPLRYVFLISLVIFIFLTSQSLFIINKGIEPALIEIAETRTRQIAAQAINDAISKKIAEGIDINKLIVKHEANDGTAYSFDPTIYNRVIAESTERVQQYLDYVESGEFEKLQSFKSGIDIDYEESKEKKGIVYYIPLGLATNNTLLSNLGPQVPVQFEIIGDVQSSVATAARELGINNTYMEVYINISVEMNVIIPRRTETIVIKNKIKVGDLFIPGKVPEFYNGSGEGASPSIELSP